MGKEQDQEIELKLPDEEEVVEEVVEETPQLTEAEERAIEAGWMPKDEWVEAGNDPDEWIPAKQFNRNGELFGRINTYKHKIIDLEKSMKALVDHNAKLFDAGYKTAVKDLKSQRKEALLEGDTEKVLEIDDKIEELQEDHKTKQEEFQRTVQSQQNQPHPAWEPWVERNSWYTTNAEMRGAADGIAKSIVDGAQATGTAVDYPKLLNEVARKIRQRYSEHFQNDRREVSAVTPKGDDDARSARRKATSPVSLSRDEQEAMDRFVSMGVMTKEEYIDQLQKIKKGNR